MTRLGQRKYNLHRNTKIPDLPTLPTLYNYGKNYIIIFNQRLKCKKAKNVLVTDPVV